MLAGRLRGTEVMRLARSGRCEELFALLDDRDERVAYNAAWILTHLPTDERRRLIPRRDRIIDRLLNSTHTGLRRLLLTLLESMPLTAADVRTDYLDFCLAHINALDPYAIRSLCLKQAYAQCRYYPELMGELQEQMELMESIELPPGLKSSIRIVRRRIAKESSVL